MVYYLEENVCLPHWKFPQQSKPSLTLPKRWSGTNSPVDIYKNQDMTKCLMPLVPYPKYYDQSKDIRIKQINKMAADDHFPSAKLNMMLTIWIRIWKTIWSKKKHKQWKYMSKIDLKRKWWASVILPNFN